jgi:TonB family protein
MFRYLIIMAVLVLPLAMILQSCTYPGGAVATQQERDLSGLPGPDDYVQIDDPPLLIREETPFYPRLAQQAGLEGTVLLKLLIGTRGKVLDAIVHEPSGTPSLDEAAIHAAYKNLYLPAKLDHKSVAAWVIWEVEFKQNY